MHNRESILENETHRLIWDFDIQGAYDKFPYVFCMDTFIDSTHMKL